MAATAKQAEKSYTFDDVSRRAIQKIFTADTADVWFCFPADDPNPEHRKIGAHKQLLSAISPVFAAMFNGSWKESTQVDLVDASAAAFAAFLCYFYANEVVVGGEHAVDILNLANKYDLPDLVGGCVSFLLEHVDADNAIDCLGVARTYGAGELAAKCVEVIGADTLHVINSPAFLRCDESVLLDMLAMESSSCTEAEIFDACVEWAESNCCRQSDISRSAKLRKALGGCIHRIRFAEMDTSARHERLTRLEHMFSKSEIARMIESLPEVTDDTRHRYRRRIATYAFEFARDEASDDLESRVLQFKVSHDVQLMAFRMPKGLVDGLFGGDYRYVDVDDYFDESDGDYLREPIGDDFRGSIVVYESSGVRPPVPTFHQFWRAKSNDTTRDYCFLLSPIKINHKCSYTVELKTNTQIRWNIVVKQHVEKGITLFPCIYDRFSADSYVAPFLTHFAALYFEKCDNASDDDVEDTK